MKTLVTAAAACAVLVAGLGAPAQAAAPRVAVVGECYAITYAQAAATSWPAVTPVPCTGPHTVEVTAAGPIPADVNSKTWIAEQCSPQETWAAVGVNRTVNGVIRDPLRVSSYTFTNPDGTFTCVAAATRFLGPKKRALQTLAAPIGQLARTDRAALRYCLSASGGRKPNLDPVSVSCSRANIWVATQRVDMGRTWSRYPGNTTINRAVRSLCPAGVDWATWPLKDQWTKGGSNYMTCFDRRR